MSSNDVNMQKAIFASLQSSRPPPAASRPLPATRTSFTSTFGEPLDSRILPLSGALVSRPGLYHLSEVCTEPVQSRPGLCGVCTKRVSFKNMFAPTLTWMSPSSPQPPRGAAQYPDVLHFHLIQSGQQRNQGGVSIRFREKGYPRYLVRRHPQGRLRRLREAGGLL
jgi:hypothetical protein